MNWKVKLNFNKAGWNCSQSGLACATDETKRNSGLAQSAKQRQNFCYGPPPVYQDVSTRQDWPVNKAIAHLPVRLKGKSQTLLTGVRLLCDAGNKWLWRAAELCVLLVASVVTVRFECACYGCSESYSWTVHCNVNRKFAIKMIQYPTTASNVCWYSRIIPILQTLSFSKFPIIPTRQLLCSQLFARFWQVPLPFPFRCGRSESSPFLCC